MVAKIFEDFDPPSKKFLAAPLVILAIEIEWQLHFYRSDIQHQHVDITNEDNLSRDISVRKILWWWVKCELSCTKNQSLAQCINMNNKI